MNALVAAWYAELWRLHPQVLSVAVLLLELDVSDHDVQAKEVDQ